MLDRLDLEGDFSSVGLRWEKWKRALYVYLEAADIQSAQRKRATLLHFGGTALQEIYYNLPGAHIEPSAEVDVFEVAIEKLNQYFLPKQSKVYERHIFRLLQQEEGETFEKFMIRLRNQAEKCGFDRCKIDERLIDQITEKCTSMELRKKILTEGDSITLEKIIIEANTLEAVKHQLVEYEKKEKYQDINEVTQNYSKEGNTRKRNGNYRCSRCGSDKHNCSSTACPAKNRKCHSCGKAGHYRQYCRSNIDQTKKRKADHGNSTQKSKRQRRAKVETDFVEDEEVDYVFHIDDDSNIKCIIGGIQTDVLIDSGCRLNLLTDKTWEYLKKKKVKAFNQIKRPEKTLLAYGSSTPLDVKGSFESIIEANGNKVHATFYVIAGGTRNLLGKITATQLGVLKIGIEINTVGSQPFPKFKDTLIEIPIDEAVKPVSQPYRRIPIPIEKKVEQKIQELLDCDIIEEVQGSSRWVSPIVPVLKPDGELRVCVDMRRANVAIMKENHPLPSIDLLLPKIRKAKWFSKLDIKNAFYQVELHPNSRYITTFMTSKGLYQYKRLMFGITCAPELFQKILERKIIHCDGALNFIDDILVFGENEKNHDDRLSKVLDTLKKNNVLLNEKKCIYKVQEVEFLGNKLTAKGVKPLERYIDSIRQFRAPETIEELQSFLGLANYVNKWIPNLATVTEPLKQLLRKKLGKTASIKKLWLKEQKESFEKIKQILTKIQTLGYYDVEDKTQVIADASPVGLGAVLLQINHEGPRIIAYGDRTLTDCERRYSQTEKEALALVWSVEHFNIFLFGKEFELVTDHKPLEFIFGVRSKPCARIERWVLRLQSTTTK
nr:unnamed protein product [Callosobruchus analis]